MLRRIAFKNSPDWCVTKIDYEAVRSKMKYVGTKLVTSGKKKQSELGPASYASFQPSITGAAQPLKSTQKFFTRRR